MAGLLSLSQALFTQVNTGTAPFYLINADQQSGSAGSSPFNEGAGQVYQSGFAFQYFPESLTDTKAINYQQKEIPGGSLPLYQWVNSGARLISFTARFSCDMDLELDPDHSANQDLVDQIKEVGEDRRNVDIRSAILWLRSFTQPTYVTGGASGSAVLTKAPPKCLLFMPNSGIGRAGGFFANDSVDSVICVMTQCDITYEAFFPSNLPKLASVQLTFAQVPQYSDKVVFPQANNPANPSDPTYQAGTRFFGYSIKKL